MAIDPAAPVDDVDLACVIVTEAVDPNGDAVTYTYAWTVDGADAGNTGEGVLAGVTVPGQTWTCTVTPSDGTLTGTPATASVTIQGENAAPSAPAVTITPAAPRDDDALTCAVVTESVDPDGDALTYAYAWTVDGADAGVSAASIDAARTRVGETWTCSVTASDGSATGEGGTASVSIAASPTCGDGSVTHTASGVDFVTVCAQTFEMGCTAGQSSCDPDELPVMAATLTHNYMLSSTEVTQGQYRDVMGTDPSSRASCGFMCPVEYVTWHMAAAFANEISARASLMECYRCSGSGDTVSCAVAVEPYECSGYRLPTEAEWEAGARCGSDTMFSGSDNIDDVAWYDGNSGGAKRAVAQKLPNACGLYDMSGGVWEWVQDAYSPTYYTAAGRVDPSGPTSGTDRTMRGGAWFQLSDSERVSARNFGMPSGRNDGLGIRLARTAP